MIEQCAYILGHTSAVVGGRIIELARPAMTPIVERDDASSDLRQRRNPAGIDPIHVRSRSKTMHENDRLTLPFIEKCNFHAVVLKTLHISQCTRLSPRRCTRRGSS